MRNTSHRIGDRELGLWKTSALELCRGRGLGRSFREQVVLRWVKPRERDQGNDCLWSAAEVDRERTGGQGTACQGLPCTVWF